jgi:hypothetical protein
MISRQDCKLWTISEDENTYNRYHRMLDGSLKNIVDAEKLNISLLANSSEYFKDKDYAIILHDPSDIRKPHSKQLESLGNVKSLEGKIINGYRTINSIAVNLRGSSLRLLFCIPYSTGDEAFVGSGEAKSYETGQVKDPQRRKQIAHHQQEGSAYNLKDLLSSQITEIDKTIKEANPDAVRVHVLDREFDDKEVFEMLQKQGDLFVIRAKANRNADERKVDQHGKEKPVKLNKQVLFNGFERDYAKIAFKKKVYQNAKGVFEYGSLSIEGHTYSVARVCFYTRKGQRIFKDPMLLITNMQLDNDRLCELAFEFYMKRSKIESVFRFCKEVLGWEKPRVDNFECFKNILALVYFIAGYFYEVEPQLTSQPQAVLLAKLGNGKGKVTSYYILKGLQKVAMHQQMQQLLDENDVSQEQIEQINQTFKLDGL